MVPRPNRWSSGFPYSANLCALAARFMMVKDRFRKIFPQSIKGRARVRHRWLKSWQAITMTSPRRRHGHICQDVQDSTLVVQLSEGVRERRSRGSAQLGLTMSSTFIVLIPLWHGLLNLRFHVRLLRNKIIYPITRV